MVCGFDPDPRSVERCVPFIREGGAPAGAPMGGVIPSTRRPCGLTLRPSGIEALPPVALGPLSATLAWNPSKARGRSATRRTDQESFHVELTTARHAAPDPDLEPLPTQLTRRPAAPELTHRRS